MSELSTLDALRRGDLTGCRRLTLSASLTEVPEEVLGLADSLEVLDLSHNRLSALPDWLARLPHLQVLFASYNDFTVLPEVLGDCPQLAQVGLRNNRIAHLPAAALPPRLRWLTLTANQLGALPPELGRCQALEKLMLSGNRLACLPEALAGLPRLALLRMAANAFTALPGWVFELPALAWLAAAGNPWPDGGDTARGGALGRVTTPELLPWAAPAAPAPIALHTLALGAELGRGASGITRAAQWRRPDGGSQPVAVKQFGHAAVTSDGTPASELAACLAAGPHPALSSALGRVAGLPDGEAALVMPLLPPELQVLAAPPSLASCSRDVYAEGRHFTAAQAAAVGGQVGQALAHLHRQGVLHGDVYAHNILWAPQPQDPALPAARAVLTDFGAALRWPVGLTPHWAAAQRLEVLAFGHLLSELLARLQPGPEAQALLHAWQPWVARCCAARPAERPLMAEVLAGLAAAQPTVAGSTSR
jgi:hypothetical protein